MGRGQPDQRNPEAQLAFLARRTSSARWRAAVRQESRSSPVLNNMPVEDDVGRIQGQEPREKHARGMRRALNPADAKGKEPFDRSDQPEPDRITKEIAKCDAALSPSAVSGSQN
jgi:hypothetical protein